MIVLILFIFKSDIAPVGPNWLCQRNFIGMRFSLRQVKYFAATAELGQISRAAVALSVSQSAITISIRELEEGLGYKLFSRQSHGMELTDTGRLFLTRAYAILAAVEDARNLPQQIAPVSGEITLAATYTVMGYFLPDHLQRLSLLYPAIHIRMLELDRETIESGLLAQEYDMAMLLTSNVRNPAIHTETLFSSRRRLWVSTQHRFAKDIEVSLAEIAKEPFIMLTVDEAADSALRYWHQHGCEPAVCLNTTSIEAVRSLVANNLGVAILSDMVYRPWSLEGKRIETIKTVESLPSMNVGLAWPADKRLNPAMQTVLQYFKQRYLEPEIPHSGAHR